MNYFFKNISDLKKHIGGGANMSVEIESISPSIRDAADMYIRPWLGDTLMQELEAAFFADVFSIEQSNLIEYMNRALAKFAAYKYSKIAAVQVSETGILRGENESFKTAFRYQEDSYRAEMIDSAYEALESLLKFLSENRAKYPNWINSEGQTKHDNSFLRYTSELRANYSSYVGRQTYETIRPIIEDVQCFAIESTIPAALFDRLKTAYLENTGTTKEKAAIAIIQRIIANFSIEEALLRHWVYVSGNRILHKESAGDQAAHNTKAASNAQVDTKFRQHDITANRYISKLTNYIKSNAADFSLAFCQADGGTNQDADAWCTASVAESTQKDCCARETCRDSCCNSGCNCSNHSPKNAIIRF